ncbi:response regulator [Pedobacter frigidisoli]|uniref:Response regulator n=1 Tax=Pedobacter frigidisoli TaxID=2530455 RepID=A0A4R0P044_9SPHI|nr:response regulator [Pedobacter frigidisoli]TCD08550.1 response regulator [Pedobacter frigidisoli]
MDTKDGPVNLKSIDVLIIEDNKVDQKLLSSYLREYDISFKCVENGLNAIDMLNKFSFRLLLLDIGLPEMNGYQLTQTIRNDLKLSMPIVAITAHNVEDVKAKCFAVGMSGCFGKPIGKIELVGVLTQFLPKEVLSSGQAPSYDVIDLSYLKEISMGDEDYEKEITGKFIEMIDLDLTTLQKHFAAQNDIELKSSAHHLRSTIYIMGLKAKLDAQLMEIEYNELSLEQLASHMVNIAAVCKKAKLEAKIFLSTIGN